eukprot:CFRG3709T1
MFSLRSVLLLVASVSTAVVSAEQLCFTNEDACDDDVTCLEVIANTDDCHSTGSTTNANFMLYKDELDGSLEIEIFDSSDTDCMIPLYAVKPQMNVCVGTIFPDLPDMFVLLVPSSTTSILSTSTSAASGNTSTVPSTSAVASSTSIITTASTTDTTTQPTAIQSTGNNLGLQDNNNSGIKHCVNGMVMSVLVTTLAFV